MCGYSHLGLLWLRGLFVLFVTFLLQRLLVRGLEVKERQTLAGLLNLEVHQVHTAREDRLAAICC